MTKRKALLQITKLYYEQIHLNKAFSFKKHDFADRVFTLMLVHWIHSMQMQEFFQKLQYLLATNSVNIVAGDFNFDNLKSKLNQDNHILSLRV